MKEIERKFLVNRGKMPVPQFGDDIRQGYVALDPLGTEVRIREKGGRFFLTVKSSGELERAEAEMQISEEQFEGLWDFTLGRRIEKMRYTIPLKNGLKAELDIFSGSLRGLLLVEVEFPSISSAHDFHIPEWFGEEVTNDSRYKNKNLAVNGL